MPPAAVGCDYLMRNLKDDISRLLLPRVNQPVQYLGLEINACCSSPAEADVTVAMAYPDTYGVGISHICGYCNRPTACFFDQADDLIRSIAARAVVDGDGAA